MKKQRFSQKNTSPRDCSKNRDEGVREVVALDGLSRMVCQAPRPRVNPPGSSFLGELMDALMEIINGFCWGIGFVLAAALLKILIHVTMV